MYEIPKTAFSISAATDDADPFTCQLELLQELIQNAPTEFEMGFLTGIHQFRTQLSILTNREF